MAEVNIAAAGKKPGMRRAKRLSTRVDLTPMVDLGFLLITFFVFNTRLSEPKEMRMIMPKESKDSTKIESSTVITVFPLSNGKVFYYHGSYEEAMQSSLYGFTNYMQSDGIGQVIRNKQANLRRQNKKREDLFLIIKPGPETNLQQIMNLMDEIVINDLRHYAITEMSEAEKNTLQNLNGSL